VRRPLTAPTVQLVKACSIALEASGASIMCRASMSSTGEKLVQAGAALDTLAPLVVALAPERQEARDAGQRIQFASQKMMEAGNELQGKTTTIPTGKSWLKGGSS
jgi:hypothetical protein